MDYDEEECFLLVNTTAIAFQDVIRDGEIKLQTNNLMLDLYGELTQPNEEGGVQGPTMSGLQVQHEYPMGRKLMGLWGWIKKQAKKVKDMLLEFIEEYTYINAEKRKKLLEPYAEVEVHLCENGRTRAWRRAEYRWPD